LIKTYSKSLNRKIIQCKVFNQGKFQMPENKLLAPGRFNERVKTIVKKDKKYYKYHERQNKFQICATSPFHNKKKRIIFIKLWFVFTIIFK
jgi:hypothetical protein